MELQKLVDQLPDNVPLIIKRFYSDRKGLIPVWYVEIDYKVKETSGNLETAFKNAKEKWENGRSS